MSLLRLSSLSLRSKANPVLCTGRMQKAQQMKESDYGKYTEYKVEKDVIGVSAYVKTSKT